MSAPMWVCGEVLVDLLPSSDSGERVAVIGGGPANTAKALARLGHQVEFIDGISTDHNGKSAQEELRKDGVGLSLSKIGDKPTCQAIISLDENGSARYEFLIEETATFDFSRSWLPEGFPSVLHIGTLATVIQPGASELFEWAKKISERVPIVFDPNVRPAVLSESAEYRRVVEKWVGISSVVKVSEDDIAWLYPARSEEDVAREWLAFGAELVVVTRGADGIVGITKSDVISVPGVAVSVIDTVGAGDTVGAIIVEGVYKYGVSGLKGDVLKSVLQRAAKAASVTVGRRGAQPPFLHEIGEM
jgi:fructokinase